MPSVLIPTPLRKLTNDLEEVSAAGGNIGELLDNLDKAFPGLKDRVCDEAGAIRRLSISTSTARTCAFSMRKPRW